MGCDRFFMCFFFPSIFLTLFPAQFSSGDLLTIILGCFHLPNRGGALQGWNGIPWFHRVNWGVLWSKNGMFFQGGTPPKFNSSPLTNGAWKSSHSYWVSVTFQGRFLLNFRRVLLMDQASFGLDLFQMFSISTCSIHHHLRCIWYESFLFFPA